MISLDALRRVAGTWGMAPEVVEKDYCLGWFLHGMALSPLQPILVLKGGTALRKVYFPTYRFSEDLDYTISQPIEETFLRNGLERAAVMASRNSGMTFALAVLEQVRMDAETPAWQARVEFVGPRRQARAPRRIRLDITAFEHILLPPASRSLLHPYLDDCTAQISVYQLEELFAEKLRTVLQRGYPRDVYDVWYLLQHAPDPFDKATFQEVFARKCAYKEVQYTGIEQVESIFEVRQTVQHWNQSLSLQIRDLPDWDTVQQELRQGLEARLE